MTFKIGDKVRIIKNKTGDVSKGNAVGQTFIIKKDEGSYDNEQSWCSGVTAQPWSERNECDKWRWKESELELVTPAPLTFEVGKSYKFNDKWVNNIYTVEFVSPITGAALATTESNGKIISVCLPDIKRYSEVVPPPPEEWRALFYRKDSKPEISANFWSSKKEVEESESGRAFEFMYAIRTDINAKKEN